MDGLVGFVLPRQGHAFSSFVVGVARKDDEGLERTFVSSLDSCVSFPPTCYWLEIGG